MSDYLIDLTPSEFYLPRFLKTRVFSSLMLFHLLTSLYITARRQSKVDVAVMQCLHRFTLLTSLLVGVFIVQYLEISVYCRLL
jgi:hypothetical protein